MKTNEIEELIWIKIPVVSATYKSASFRKISEESWLYYTILPNFMSSRLKEIDSLSTKTNHC